MASAKRHRVYRVVRRIPQGCVAIYGEVAALADWAGAARAVGNALSARPGPIARVPWHRAVNTAGKISLRPDGWSERQRELLEREGVRFRRGGAVDLGPHRRARWRRR